jgi:predicted CoA-substrate-specific enzyme activase
MATIGIDMGYENIKVVVLKDGEIIGRAKTRSGGIRRLEHAEAAVQDALKSAGLAYDTRVDKIIATGKGKFDIESIVDDVLTEPVTAVKAAEFLVPDATTVADIGADETIVMLLGRNYKTSQLVTNEKCAAGVGSFLRNMARRLELTPDEMGSLPQRASDAPSVSDGCVVFGELDALNLLNNGVSPTEVAQAVIASAVIRATVSIRDITLENLDRLVVFGGVTNNKSFMEGVKNRLGVAPIVPADAEYAGALGAALYAAGWGVNNFVDVEAASA